MRETAERLVERFSWTVGRLYEDTRPTMDALLTAGYPLPPELRAPTEMALAQRFEAEIAIAAGRIPVDPQAFGRVRAVVAEARRAGLLGAGLVTPRAADVMHRCITAAVDGALADGATGHVDTVLALFRLIRELDIAVDTDALQERVFAALQVLPDDPGLGRLAAALDVAG